MTYLCELCIHMDGIDGVLKIYLGGKTAVQQAKFRR